MLDELTCSSFWEIMFRISELNLHYARNFSLVVSFMVMRQITTGNCRAIFSSTRTHRRFRVSLVVENILKSASFRNQKPSPNACSASFRCSPTYLFVSSTVVHRTTSIFPGHSSWLIAFLSMRICFVECSNQFSFAFDGGNFQWLDPMLNEAGLECSNKCRYWQERRIWMETNNTEHI